MPMPTYELHNIPSGLWKRFTDRAATDGYPLQTLMMQLMEDYAIGRVQPGGAPAPLQTYAFLKEPFEKLIKANPGALQLPVRERWDRLREVVVMDEGEDSPHLETIDAVAPQQRVLVLNWLNRLLA